MNGCVTGSFLSRLCRSADFTPCRALFVTAHPDDEVIGAGGQFRKFDELTIVHVTDGSPGNPVFARSAGFASAQEYAKARLDEYTKALLSAGLDRAITRRLAFTDQEVSTHLEECASALVGILSEVKPDVVFTHAYEGGHPDHDGVSFAVQSANMLLSKKRKKPYPVYEFASYHGRDGMMVTYRFIPNAHDGRVWTAHLTSGQVEVKRRMIACYISQKEMLQAFPVKLERFRKAPRYDYLNPPHQGRLFYECFDRGMSGDRWRSLASKALHNMEIG